MSWIHFPVLGMDFMNPKYLKYADGHLVINSATVEQLETLGILKNNIKIYKNEMFNSKLFDNKEKLKIFLLLKSYYLFKIVYHIYFFIIKIVIIYNKKKAKYSYFTLLLVKFNI